MFSTPLVRCFCQIYSVLLYAYPRDFRQEFGDEMLSAFRDRCRYLLRTKGTLRMVRFVALSGFDWMATAFRETAEVVLPAPAAVEAPLRSNWRGRISQLARSIWTNGRKTSPRGLIIEWAMTILVYLFATTTLVQAFVVPTGSMEGTLLVGDHMLVDRMVFSDPGAIGRHLLPYRDVQRGDIVAFIYPEDIRQTYVKRVIGLPGDRIHMVARQVVRNGHPLVESYTRHLNLPPDRYRDNFPAPPDWSVTQKGRDMLANNVHDGELVVPPGVLFVMGDNRENSADSRYWGFVPRNYVVGKPLVVYWSYEASTEELTEWSVNHMLDVALHFFSKTHWERTLLVPRSQAAIELEAPR